MDLNVIASSAGPPIVFMLAIWFLTLGFRRVLEKTWPSITNKTFWKEVFLPLMPPVLGAICAVVMYKFPFLDKLPSMGTRAFYGFVAGGCSGFLYRILKAVVKKTYGVELSTPPGAVAGTVMVDIPKDQLAKIDIHESTEKPDDEIEAPDEITPPRGTKAVP